MATPVDPPHRDRRFPAGRVQRTEHARARRTDRARAHRTERARGHRIERARVRRLRYRRQRSSALALLLIAAVLVGVDLAHGQEERPPPGGDPATSGSGRALDTVAVGTISARPGAVRTGSGAAGPGYPVTGPGSFRYASGTGPVLGASGPLLRYRVAVEDRIGQDVGGFAAQVEAILGDGRGWTASNRLRLQRVPRASPADFTVFLATPASSERMCAAGGLHTERYTSCRLPGEVIINLARWLTAVPEYGAPVEVYRAYAVNHEVGHQLGHGHEACPGGGPAPVMQQQTYGLRGCTANGWPYLSGRRHSGPAVP